MFVVGRLFILSCSLNLGMAEQLKRKASQRRLSLRTRQKITSASKEREAKKDEPESLSDEIVEAAIDDSQKNLTELAKVKEKDPD